MWAVCQLGRLTCPLLITTPATSSHAHANIRPPNRTRISHHDVHQPCCSRVLLQLTSNLDLKLQVWSLVARHIRHAVSACTSSNRISWHSRITQSRIRVLTRNSQHGHWRSDWIGEEFASSTEVDRPPNRDGRSRKTNRGGSRIIDYRLRAFIFPSRQLLRPDICPSHVIRHSSQGNPFGPNTFSTGDGPQEIIISLQSAEQPRVRFVYIDGCFCGTPRPIAGAAISLAHTFDFSNRKMSSPYINSPRTNACPSKILPHDAPHPSAAKDPIHWERYLD